MKGFLLISILSLATIACTKDQKPPYVPPNQIGRFQLIQLGTMRRDQYLIDTETGKLWTTVCGVPSQGIDCRYSYWRPEDVVGINATPESVDAYSELIKRRNSK